MDKPFRCQVDAGLFRRAMSCVVTDEARYYLTGVHVEPAVTGGALLVASDGLVLVVLHDPLALIEGAGTAWVTWANMLRPMEFDVDGRSDALVIAGDYIGILEDREPTLAAAHDALLGEYNHARRVTGHVIEESAYPDWRRVIPRGVSHAPSSASAFSSRLLDRVVSALIEPGGYPHFSIHGNGDPNGPHVLRVHQSPHFAVIMPIKNYQIGAGLLPAYLGLGSGGEAA